MKMFVCFESVGVEVPPQMLPSSRLLANDMSEINKWVLWCMKRHRIKNECDISAGVQYSRVIAAASGHDVRGHPADCLLANKNR